MGDRAKGLMLRTLFYAAGIMLLGLGIVLNTKAALGVGPINSLPYALSVMAPLSLGTASMLLYFVFTAAQLAIYRRLDARTLLQIPFSFVMGRVIDFYDALLTVAPANLITALLLLAAALVFTALGAYLMVTMDYIHSPADGMAKAVGVALKIDIGKGKIILDCVMTAITAAVTLIFARRLIGIGVGTVIAALVTGWLIRVSGKLLDRLLGAVLSMSRKRTDADDDKI